MDSKKKLSVLITSGGTSDKIDDVRHIGNFSMGTTGALIAEEFLKRGHCIYYVYGKNAYVPFKRNMILDSCKPKEQELERLSRLYDEFSNYKNSLVEYPITTFQSYYNTVQDILNNNKVNVVVLAAAVGDYCPIKQNGKISSDKDSLVIEMKKNPKVIQLIKEWNPNVYLVGFKLLSNVSEEELLRVAKENAKKTFSDMTVANLFPNHDLMEAKTYLLYDAGYIPIKRRGLADILINLVETELNKK